jgi:hypothetical protein
MAQNPLNYTGLTYSEIKQQIENLLRADPRFKNFVDSAIYKTVIDMFAATTDLTNYYIERTAEESYLDTARHLSSGILLSNQLGYVVRRATPAWGTLKIVLKGPFPISVVADDQVNIPAYSAMSFGGKQYIIAYNYIYTLTTADIAALSNAAGRVSIVGAYRTDLTIEEQPTGVAIDCIQGEVKTLDITPQVNQYGSKYQKYTLDIPEFSNIYGQSDLGYDSLNSIANIDSNLTKVSILDTGSPSTNIEFEIDRRSIVLNPQIVSADDPSIVNVCLIKTNKDTTVDLSFGDGVVGAIGPTQTTNYLRVQYFVTEGSAGNQVGIIGNKLTYSGSPIYANAVDVTNNVEFYFNGNCVGGADFEDLDSIKAGAPGIYQAMDRLVTKADYNAFMKTIVTPIDMRYGIAWGEAEEASARGVAAVREMFNAVIVSGMGDLYTNNDGTWLAKDCIVDLNSFDADDSSITTYADNTSAQSFLPQQYYNLYVKGDMVSATTIQENVPDIYKLIKQFDNKSQITVKNYYITPLAQRFELTGNVYLKGFSNAATVKTDMENSIYSYLNNNTQYGSSIYLSNLVDLIQSNANVVKSDVQVTPIGSDIVFTGQNDISESGDYTVDQVAAIYSAIQPLVGAYIDSGYVANGNVAIDALSWFSDVRNSQDTSAYTLTVDTKTIESSGNPMGLGIYRDFGPWDQSFGTPYAPDAIGFGYSDKKQLDHITERSFYYDLMKKIYDATGGYISATTGVAYNQSSDFIAFMKKLNGWFKIGIRNGMLDTNGNITNYSFQNEIAQIKCNLTYLYL